jgi:hypothetical protein
VISHIIQKYTKCYVRRESSIIFRILQLFTGLLFCNFKHPEHSLEPPKEGKIEKPYDLGTNSQSTEASHFTPNNRRIAPTSQGPLF